MQKLLVVRPGALGDTILTLPALKALRLAFPAAALEFAGNALLIPSLLASGYADVAFSFDDQDLGGLFASPNVPLPASLSRFANIDLAVLWLRDHAAVATNLRRLGARNVLAAPSRPAEDDGVHIVDYLVGSLRPVIAGVGEGVLAQPSLQLTARGEAFASGFWAEHALAARPVVAIHPGSGGSRKCWPPSRFAEVADTLARRGVAVLLTAGPADVAVAARFLGALRVARPIVARDLEIENLAALLARCAAYAGNDSGVSHLAAAAGAPTVAVYGPTDPAVWGVRGKRVTVLRGETLEAVTAGAVSRAVEDLFATPR